MSRPPFHPGQDRPQSPFDRPPPQGSGPAPSFKTNVNRNKTRKWVEARHNNYDGDDWGGFDPYDEYGSYDEPASQQPPPLSTRKHSFDRGEERRAFSAGVAPPQGYGQFPQASANPQQSPGLRPRTGSQGSRDPESLRRDFSQPAQVPQPLHMRPAPPPNQGGPRGLKSQPSNTPGSAVEQLPLRDANTVDNEKPAAAIPFIRPSDIYKRMEQAKEQERQSSDSSRPSIESSSSKPQPSEVGHQHISSGQIPMQANNGLEPATQSAPAPHLSSVDRNPQQRHLEGSGGFQTMVDHAFNHPHDNSVPPTPVSTHIQQVADQDLSRSNTDSTSGISPIMSRVPSSGNANSRNRAAAAATSAELNTRERVSTISEEIPVDPQKQLAAHRRTSGTSFGSIPRKEVTSPSPHASPARSPMVETDNRRLSQAMAAELSEEPRRDVPSNTDHAHVSNTTTMPNLDTDQTASEPDGKTVRTLASVEALKQSSLLSSPLASPVLSSPGNGRTSPFPGRVKNLAGKYNGIHEESRRNSQMSLESKRSFGSLSRNGGSLRITRTGTIDSLGQGPITDEPTTMSPTENPEPYTQQDRPLLHPQASFRPSLPGEWISTSDIRQGPAEPITQGPSDAAAQQSPPSSVVAEKALPKTPTLETKPSEVDFAANTRSVERQTSVKGSESSPIDVLKAAGQALGESLRLSVGSAHQSKDFASREEPVVEESQTSTTKEARPAVGDVFLRPLHFDRTASSIASSVAPTPPAKDTPKVLDQNSEREYFQHSNMQDDAHDQPSTRGSVDETDFTESDRLHDDIVRSLSPHPDHQMQDQSIRDQDALDAPHNLREVQHAEGIEPSEPGPSLVHHSEPQRMDHANATTEAVRPELLTQRFSWENRTSGFFNPSGLGPEVDLPQTDLRVMNAEPEVQSPDLEVGDDRTPIASEFPTTSRMPEDVDDRSQGPVSPLVGTDTRLSTFSNTAPSPIIDQEPEILGRNSYEREATVTERDATLSERDTTSINRDATFSERDPTSVERDATSTITPEAPLADARAPSVTGPTRIPPFREILTIKSSTDRIAAYESTRRQFAEMNTGLRDWLATTMASRPEHGHLHTEGPSVIPGGPVPDSIRHRPTQSVVKLVQGLGSSGKGDGPSSPSTDTHGGPTRRVTNNYGHSPQSSANVEKMQAMGKDLLSSAGRLGGKGVVGAKGWLAKGRQKLRETSGGGGDKAITHEPLSPVVAQGSELVAMNEAPKPELDRPHSPALPADDLIVPKAPSPRLHIRSSSTRSIQRMVSGSRKSSPLATPTLDQPPDVNPGFSESPILAVGPARPRLHQRSSSSWSSHRLSSTVDRIRNSVSERSRSRSRPQSLILPSRTPPPNLQIGTTELRLDDLEERSPIKVLEHSAGSTPSPWTSTWEAGVPNTPATAFLNNGGNYRLGVLPSPGVESFLEAQSSGLRTPVAGSPLRMGSLAPVPPAAGQAEQERPRTAPLGRTVSREDPDAFGNHPGLNKSRVLELKRSSTHEGQPRTANVTPGRSASESTSSHSFDNIPPVIDCSVRTTDGVVTQEAWQPEQVPSSKMEEGASDGPGHEGDQSTQQQVSTMISEPGLASLRASNMANDEVQAASALATSTETGGQTHPDMPQHTSIEVDQPRHLALGPMGSPGRTVIDNRSSVSPPRTIGSPYSSQQVTPRRHFDPRTSDRRNIDSPTLPAHLTPYSPTLPQHMFDGDHSTVTTPGNEGRPVIGAPYSEALHHSPTAPTLREAAQKWPAPDSPPFVPQSSANNFADQRSVEVPQGGHTYIDQARDRSNRPNRESLGQDSGTPYSADYQRPSQVAGQRFVQGSRELPTDLDRSFGGPLRNQNSEHYARAYDENYQPSNLADMSPQEAALADREALFEQATISHQQASNAMQGQSRSSSIGADAMFTQAQDRSQGAPSGIRDYQHPGTSSIGMAPGNTTSAATPVPSSDQISGAVPTREFHEAQSGPPGKLVKKDRRFSLHRSSSTLVAEGNPETEKKKKRFSGLGSLFGRSKSSASKEPLKETAAPKRNRLSKQGPMLVPPTRPSLPEEIPAPPGFGHGAPPSNQATLVHDDMHPRSHTPVSRKSSTHMSPMLGGAGSPLSGWSNQSGQSRQSERAEPTVPNIEPSRRLHSSKLGSSKRFSYADVAEEFRPTAASYRPGASPRDQARLGQAFGEPPSVTSSPVINRGYPGASPSQNSGNQAWSPVQPNVRHSSVLTTGSGGVADISRRGSSGVSHASGSSSQRHSYYNDRSGSIGQVSANLPPPGWADYGGYYIPQQRTSSPHAAYRQNTTDQRPGQQSRRSSLAPSLSNSAQQSRRGSTYMATDAAQYTAGEQQAFRPPHSRHVSREMHSPSLQNQPGPSPQQTKDHNEWSRREVERRQREIIEMQGSGQMQNPEEGGYDAELYESTYRQPRRSLEQQTRPNPDEGTQRLNEQAQMKPTSYPGQEWTPRGVPEGNYEWE